MPPPIPSLIVDGLLFPESPRWHDGSLWFSDMFRGQVWRLNVTTGARELVLQLDGRTSGLGWLPDGSLLVVSMHDRAVLRVDAAGVSVYAALAPFVTGDPNDMVVAPSGRAYVGNFGHGYAEGLAPEPANIVCIESDGAVRVVAEDLLFPNGAVITPGGERLIVAEGFGSRLTSFRIDHAGNLTDRTTFASLDGEIPDGIALDSAGGIWVALPLRQEFIRVLEGGVVTERIPVAPRGAFACALGGESRRTLFMMTALGDQATIARGESEGAILALGVAVGGAGTP
jgi:sugar lactone lactonase YvrE